MGGRRRSQPPLRNWGVRVTPQHARLDKKPPQGAPPLLKRCEHVPHTRSVGSVEPVGPDLLDLIQVGALRPPQYVAAGLVDKEHGYRWRSGRGWRPPPRLARPVPESSPGAGKVAAQVGAHLALPLPDHHGDGTPAVEPARRERAQRPAHLRETMRTRTAT